MRRKKRRRNHSAAGTAGGKLWSPLGRERVEHRIGLRGPLCLVARNHCHQVGRGATAT